MKKILFLVILFSISKMGCLTAQTPLIDGDFETSWFTTTNWMGDEYDDFSNDMMHTINSLAELSSDDMQILPTAYKDEDAQNGTYAIRLVSSHLVLGEMPIFIPGVVGTVGTSFIEEFLETGGINVTVDFPDCPHSITGYYKTQLVDGDSSAIEFGLYNYTDEIYITKAIFGTSVSTWTPFTIEIPETYWASNSNKIRLLFVSSAGYDFADLTNCEGQVGTTFWIDNVVFNYGSGITQNLFSDVKVNLYPNPTTDFIKFDFNKSIDGQLVIFNSLGQEVMNININDNSTIVNTESLSSGNYIYRLMNGKSIEASGKFVVNK